MKERKPTFESYLDVLDESRSSTEIKDQRKTVKIQDHSEQISESHSFKSDYDVDVD